MNKKYVTPAIDAVDVNLMAVINLSADGEFDPNQGGGEETKSRNEFEDFVSSQESTKTNSLW